MKRPRPKVIPSKNDSDLKTNLVKNESDPKSNILKDDRRDESHLPVLIKISKTKRKKKNKVPGKSFARGSLCIISKDQTAVDVKIEGGEIGMNLAFKNGFLEISSFPDLEDGSRSVAKDQGLLNIGSQLINIDGKSLDGFTHEGVLDLLRSAVNPPVLRFKHPCAPSPEVACIVSENRPLSAAEKRHWKSIQSQIKVKELPFEVTLARELEAILLKTHCVLWTKLKGLRVAEPGSHAVVSVIDLSIREAHRVYLGSRKSRWSSIKRNKNSGCWESRIYQLRISAETIFPLEPEVRFVGSFSSEKQATKEADAALALRDAGKCGLVPKPCSFLCSSSNPSHSRLLTHLQIRIVSDAFIGLSFWERWQLAWKSLLACNVSQNHLISEEISRMRGVSYFGTQSRDQWKRLPINVEFVCLDNSTSLPSGRQIPSTIPVHNRDLKKKTFGVKDFTTFMDRSNDFGKTKSGIFGHFYGSLSVDAKAMVNDHSLREENRVKSLRRAVILRPSIFSAGNNNDQSSEMQHWRIDRSITNATVILQRIFRRRLNGKVIKGLLKTTLRVVLLQKVIRRYIAWRRTCIWREIANRSATKIQSLRRMFIARMKVRKIRAIKLHAVLRIQMVMKVQRKRAIERLRMRYDWAVTKMQKIYRGHNARCWFKRRMAELFHRDVVIPATATLQRVLRGMVARRVAACLRKFKHHINVIVPSATIVQSLWRMQVARAKLARLKKNKDASRSIQKILRGRLARNRCFILSEIRKLDRASTRISSIVRGYVCRQLVRYLKAEKYHDTVVVPACVKIQGVWRCLEARRRFYLMMHQNGAVQVIQTAYRSQLERRKARAQIDKLAFAYKTRLATRLQATFRGYHGRKVFLLLSRQRDARRLWAVSVIQKFRKQLQTYRLKKQRKRDGLKLVHFLDLEIVELDIKEVVSDIQDAEFEIERVDALTKYATRFKRKLKKERRDIEARLPLVEHELKQLDPDDDSLESWREAYETEIDLLSNGISMCNEDIQSKSFQLGCYHMEHLDLEMELEELKIFMESYAVKKVVLLEKYRLAEIELCNITFEKHRERMVSKQKNRWRVKDIRKKIISRNNNEKVYSSKDITSLDRLHTISVDKRIFYHAKDQLIESVQTTRDKLHKKAQIIENGEGSAALRGTYDKVINATKEVLQLSTYELRRPKKDIRGDPRKICFHCGLPTIACKCCSICSQTFCICNND